MSDGWDGAGARHDQPSDDKPTDTTLHEALIEAHRAVRQGDRDNRIQARDDRLRAVIDALDAADELESALTTVREELVIDGESGVSQSQLVAGLARVGLVEVLPEVDSATDDALVDYVREYKS